MDAHPSLEGLNLFEFHSVGLGNHRDQINPLVQVLHDLYVNLLESVIYQLSCETMLPNGDVRMSRWLDEI
jgi:hypothetical protein